MTYKNNSHCKSKITTEVTSQFFDNWDLSVNIVIFVIRYNKNNNTNKNFILYNSKGRHKTTQVYTCPPDYMSDNMSDNMSRNE